MSTSEQYHRPVLEACAFVRDRTQQPDAADAAAKVPPAADVQARLTALGWRSNRAGAVAVPTFPKAHLTYANLTGADLTREQLDEACDTAPTGLDTPSPL